jgi:protoporphyrinogen oxidase
MGTSAVIGGGVLGLSVAQRLSQRGDEVTLYEAAPDLGGLASGWRIGDVQWDRHYHVTLQSDARTRAMLASLGLEDELQWVATRTGFYAGPEVGMRSVSNAVEFLKLPTLSPVGKARLGATILRGSRIKDGYTMEKVSASVWLRRWSGDATFERFWLPLLRAKLGDGWQQASAAFIWATIQRLYRARRAGMKQDLFGYVPGGYSRVFERFAEVLHDQGVKLNVGTKVSAVRRVPEGLKVVSDGGEATYDRVVVTLAGPMASALCEDLNAEEHRRLEGVTYMGVVCASMLTRKPLGGYYLTYITDPATPFTAVVEMSAFVDKAEFGDWNLVYLPKYVAPDDPLLDADDDGVRAEFLPYLKRMYPTLSDDDIGAFQVSRVRRVFAVPTLRYSDRMPPKVTSVPGLQLLGSAHLPFATLNVDDTLSLLDDLL